MAEASSRLDLEIDGRELSISRPEKVFFPTRGETKLDLINYYRSVREPLMATMGNRPVMLQRFPDGATGKSFFQQRVPDNAPDWLTTTEMSTPNGTRSRVLVVADIAHVAWAVNLGCLGFHVWATTADRPDSADELRIDLDPSPGVTFAMIVEAAHETRRLFEELGIASYPKTTGNRGIHVYVRTASTSPIDVRAAAVAVARELERRRPELITAAWWKEERGERVFVDFNQNAPHKTVFGAWSVRANAHGQVSTPFSWDELDAIAPLELTLASVPARLAERSDPWSEMYPDPQSLEPLLEMSRADMSAGLMDAPWPPVYPKQPNEPPRVAPSRARRGPPVGDADGP